jgi:glyoxylase-like metal-dependent hydrolase (beta-lactamase superfamily II)
MMSKRGPSELREVGSGAHAYLQQGSWGFSNAGLISDGDATLLVDTLYDVALTEQMLKAMRSAVPAAKRIGTVVNTHANGDHCWGNQVVADAEIISSRASAAEMLELKPGLMRTLVTASDRISKLPPALRAALSLLGKLGIPKLGPLADTGEFVQDCFGAFEFGDIKLTLPTRTFEGKLTLHVGDKVVELIQVGPAHTKGDLIVWLPKERVVYTGDILFIGMHPIVWEGPISNWIAACDRLLELDAEVIVPGHGPLTDKHGVRETKAYWQEMLEIAQRGRKAGTTPDAEARKWLADGKNPKWTEAHRLVVNIDTAYRDLAGDRSLRDPLEMFARMSRLERN